MIETRSNLWHRADRSQSRRICLRMTATVLLATCIATSHGAHASQSPIAGGPIGATDINNAMLPSKAGVYLGLTEVFGYADRSAADDDHRHPGAISATTSALYLMYVYPFSLLGGTIASGVQSGYEAPGRLTTPTLGKAYQTINGWRDLYVDVLNWSHYVGPLFGEGTSADPSGQKVPSGLTFKAEYSMIFATGRYSAQSSVNPGSGTTFFIPNAAATYLTPSDRFGGPLEFDLHGFYDARARNPLNDYSNGALIDLDFAAAQRFKGFTLGFAGAYAKQVQNDTVGPAGHRRLILPNGLHYELLTLGPIVSFPIPAIHATFKIKAPFALHARNAFLINDVIANLVFPVF